MISAAFQRPKLSRPCPDITDARPPLGPAPNLRFGEACCQAILSLRFQCLWCLMKLKFVLLDKGNV